MEDNGYMGIFIYMIVNIAVDDGKQDEYTSLTMEYRPQCLCIFLRDQYFFFPFFANLPINMCHNRNVIVLCCFFLCTYDYWLILQGC
jgi:hypothetical protein